jgi:hypothetical protein
VRTEILLEAVGVNIIVCNKCSNHVFYGFKQRICTTACRKILKSAEISPCERDNPGFPIKDTVRPSTSTSLPDIAAITDSDVIIYIYEFKTFILTK